MSINKKFFVVTLLGFFVFTCMFCGSMTFVGKASAKTYTMKLGTIEPPASPKMVGMERFKELVEKKTKGGIQVKIFPSSQLGSAREMIEATQMGTEEATLTTSSNLSGFEPSVSILDLPFLFPSRDACYKVIDSPFGKHLLKTLEDDGLIGLSWWDSGFKQFTMDSEIAGLSSFKGKKIRVMENPILIAQYEAMGASAIPLNYHELYNALQQGVVNGQENPLASIYEMKFYEVQKCLAISDHAYLPLVMAVNKKWYESLPKEYQTALQEASDEASLFLRKHQLDLEFKEFVPHMEKAGIKIVHMTEKQKAEIADAIKDKTRAALMKMLDNRGKELLKELDETIAKIH